MSQIETVKIKHGDGDYAIINRSDFDPKKHKPFDDESRQALGMMSEEAERLAAEEEAKRQAEARRGQVDGSGDPADPNRNPSGTYSEPTPTDIRYPDKTETEFESNLGAQVDRSAAEIRKQKGLPDAPGGIHPVESMEVKHRGRGSYSIMSGDDEIAEGLSKADADRFGDMTADEKAAFVRERRAK